VASELSARTSDVRYARVGDRHLAYRVIHGDGDGTCDVVLILSGTMPMDALFDDRVAVRLLDELSDLGRVVVFDRCGIGLSDAPDDSDVATYDRWCDDLEAVLEAAEVERPMLLSGLNGASVPLVFAGRHPDVPTGIVVLEPSVAEPSDPALVSARLEFDAAGILCPSRADEPGFREWFNGAGRRGASPRMARRVYPESTEEDVRRIERAARDLRVPTLVLRRPAHDASPPRAADPMLERIPVAVRVDLPGEDLLVFGGELDALLAEIFLFVTGEHRAPEPDRVLAAVLYTDLVASTNRASTVGDARWKQMLDRHDAAARACIGRRGGVVVKNTGDGVLAILPSVGGAMRAAYELSRALAGEDLEMRAGVHVGDVERRGDDVAGIGVVIAARVLALAGAGEILVSSVAVGAAAGDGMIFEPRGQHELKGVPGTWQIFAAVVTA